MIKNLYKIITVIIFCSLFFSSLPTYAYDIGMIQDENNDSSFNTRPDVDHSSHYTDWYYKPSSYNELVGWYQDLETQYPDYIHVFKANELYNTGQAAGGYDIYYVRITNESRGFHKPEVFFSGGPHGDETVGAIGMYWFLEWLTRKALTDEPCEEYSKEWLNWILDNREIYCEISHNPYGFDMNQRFDANGWDLNREADYDGPGSPTGGIWASEIGKTFYRFINNHTIRVGCDFHGGIRMLLYPWAGTHNNVIGTSPISGQR
ncbi:MAG: M14 family zinc carboxypeptidase, partial [Candidatus Thermoplasmatota archaeon]|nr:M14 family zinc carboxypeptidase [Candidatus Thermoplasmatota archaeon]